MTEELNARLKILVEGAKYDVSCSSSGSNRRGSKGMLGNAEASGICHSFTSDGRCVSLLKLLMTNNCCYNCEYCVNKRSADVERATLTPTEICEITMNFYRRNYIEGLFLSSAVIESANKTMELLVETVVKLRKLYGFNGYIHLKGIPGADMSLINYASKYVDRMSFNIELPSERSLKLLAPQKSKQSIITPMKLLAERWNDERAVKGKFKRIIPAGQTTQMIVGASKETDGQIVRLSSSLYDKFHLKRVYYSSYVATVKSSILPDNSVGVLREHRLYQADWLMRFYGFTADEIVPLDQNLPTDIDPKEAWAIRNYSLFPMEINAVPYEMLLRIPGVGIRSAYKIIQARQHSKLDFNMLTKMGVVLKRARHFITCQGKFYGYDKSVDVIRGLIATNSSGGNYQQLSMFGNEETATKALLGEI